MSKKAHILTEAITLFNEKGISTVTMRQIAESLSISPGNLTYHYKTKEELVQVIYKQLHDESSDYMSSDGYVTLHDFETILEKFYNLRKRYSFFFSDITYINRQFPVVAEMYKIANIERFKQSRRLVDYYIATERMIPENEFTNYDKIVHSIWMINTFWPTQGQIMNSEDYKVNQTTPIDITWQLIFPFLTVKGKEEYLQIKKFANNKIHS